MVEKNIYLITRVGLGGCNNKINNMEFNEIYWNGSEVYNIIIDRNKPGIEDRIIFEIDFVELGKQKLIFEEVYWANFKMNFGVVASECIDIAYISEIKDDPELIDFFNKTTQLTPKLGLTCYILKTTSTNSEFKIIAKRFLLQKSDLL